MMNKHVTKKTVSRKVVKKSTVAKPTQRKTIPAVKTVARKNTLKGYSTARTKEIKFNNVEFKNGEKYNVIVNIELKNGREGLIFSASAEIKNGRDVIMGGQCLDEIYYESKLKNNKRFSEIYDLWKKYHLNDMHAGTPEQEKAIEEYCKRGGSHDYDKCCLYLKSRNLYEVIDRNGKPYKYGTAWLFEKIPDKDLRRIEALF